MITRAENGRLTIECDRCHRKPKRKATNWHVDAVYENGTWYISRCLCSTCVKRGEKA